MKASMPTKENLENFLPKSLIEVLNDRDSTFSSPRSHKSSADSEDIYQIPSPNFTPSPQIPPLESRLHSYLLKRSTEEIAKPCNLSKYFNETVMNDEIQNALKTIPQRVKIYEHLEENRFFEYVKEKVEEYQINSKTKLNAQATSFEPDYNKENICPKKIRNGRN